MDIYLINFVLCVVIVLLGIWGYQKKKTMMPLYIAIAFGLFGISHLATLLALNLGDILVLVRVIAYLVIVYALYEYVTRK